MLGLSNLLMEQWYYIMYKYDSFKINDGKVKINEYGCFSYIVQHTSTSGPLIFCLKFRAPASFVWNFSEPELIFRKTLSSSKLIFLGNL